MSSAAPDTNTLDGQTLLNSIVRLSNVLRGTQPYWNQERRNVESMCFGVKYPNMSLTFSATDLHWESLAKVMPDYQLWLAADDNGKTRIARKNLKENPHIAAWHFYRRFKVFFEEYLCKKFPVKAHWYRFEQQGRGSTPCHGLSWIDGMPTPSAEGFVDQLQQDEFLRFWGLQVSAWNPEPGLQHPPQEEDPLKAIHFWRYNVCSTLACYQPCSTT